MLHAQRILPLPSSWSAGTVVRTLLISNNSSRIPERITERIPERILTNWEVSISPTNQTIPTIRPKILTIHWWILENDPNSPLKSSKDPKNNNMESHKESLKESWTVSQWASGFRPENKGLKRPQNLLGIFLTGFGPRNPWKNPKCKDWRGIKAREQTQIGVDADKRTRTICLSSSDGLIGVYIVDIANIVGGDIDLPCAAVTWCQSRDNVCRCQIVANRTMAMPPSKYSKNIRENPPPAQWTIPKMSNNLKNDPEKSQSIGFSMDS